MKVRLVARHPNRFEEPVIKGPGLRLGIDIRRVWKCPACDRVKRTHGTVTAVRCHRSKCNHVWMRLLDPPGTAPKGLQVDMAARIAERDAAEALTKPVIDADTAVERVSVLPAERPTEGDWAERQLAGSIAEPTAPEAESEPSNSQADAPQRGPMTASSATDTATVAEAEPAASEQPDGGPKKKRRRGRRRGRRKKPGGGEASGGTKSGD